MDTSKIIVWDIEQLLLTSHEELITYNYTNFKFAKMSYTDCTSLLLTATTMVVKVVLHNVTVINK